MDGSMGSPVLFRVCCHDVFKQNIATTLAHSLGGTLTVFHMSPPPSPQLHALLSYGHPLREVESGGDEGVFLLDLRWAL